MWLRRPFHPIKVEPTRTGVLRPQIAWRLGAGAADSRGLFLRHPGTQGVLGRDRGVVEIVRHDLLACDMCLTMAWLDKPFHRDLWINRSVEVHAARGNRRQSDERKEARKAGDSVSESASPQADPTLREHKLCEEKPFCLLFQGPGAI